jgi:hypothetical protein
MEKDKEDGGVFVVRKMAGVEADENGEEKEKGC